MPVAPLCVFKKGGRNLWYNSSWESRLRKCTEKQPCRHRSVKKEVEVLLLQKWSRSTSGGTSAPDTRVEVPLQPMKEPTVEQVDVT